MNRSVLNAPPPRAIRSLLVPSDYEDDGYDSDELLFVHEKTQPVSMVDNTIEGPQSNQKVVVDKHCKKSTIGNHDAPAKHDAIAAIGSKDNEESVECISTLGAAMQTIASLAFNPAVESDTGDENLVMETLVSLSFDSDLDSDDISVFSDDLVDCIKVHSRSSVDVEIQLIEPGVSTEGEEPCASNLNTTAVSSTLFLDNSVLIANEFKKKPNKSQAETHLYKLRCDCVMEAVEVARNRMFRKPEVIIETIGTATEDPEQDTCRLKKSVSGTALPNNDNVDIMQEAVEAGRNRLVKKYGYAESYFPPKQKTKFVDRHISQRHSFTLATATPKNHFVTALKRRASWTEGDAEIYGYAHISIALPKKNPKRSVGRRNSQVFLGQNLFGTNPLMSEMLVKAQQRESRVQTERYVMPETAAEI